MLNRKLTLRNNNTLTLPLWGRNFLIIPIVSLLFHFTSSTLLADNISAVGQVTLINPETGKQTSCSATLIAANRIATVASCVLSEETKRHAQIAKVCFRVNGQRNCFNSKKILTHSNYLASSGVTDANNLAYIELDKPVTGIQPIKELTPKQFERLLGNNIAAAETLWVGYDSRGISSRLPIKKSHLRLTGLEYDYLNRRLNLETADILPGQHYEGTSVLVELNNQKYLLGMVSSTYPDDIVHYYPEVNPCDEDPVIVKYPKPIMLSQTQITAYPVAACGMIGFQATRGYNELNCVRLERRTSLKAALDIKNPIAMRQQAVELTKTNDTTDLVIDIYRLLDASMKAGDIKSNIFMAQLLLEGEVFPQDNRTARKLLEGQTLADAHWLQAKELLKAYSEQDMRSINVSLDTELYQHLIAASEAGIARAQYYLGRLYQFGIGAKEDARIAYQWYARAAMQGEPSAQFQLGSMWIDGRGVRSYPQVGYYWIRQSAARGYIRAQNYLALKQRGIDEALDEYEFEYSDT